MMAANEPGSSTGNLASSNCRYFMLGCNYRPSSVFFLTLAVCGGGSFWSDVHPLHLGV
jgi:hypothetical protein